MAQKHLKTTETFKKDMKKSSDNIYSRKSQLKNYFIHFSLLLLVLSTVFLIEIANADPDPFSISESTEYGFSENIVYVTISDNTGLDQIISVESIFSKSNLTEKIEYTKTEVENIYEKEIYEYKNISIGKFNSTLKALPEITPEETHGEIVTAGLLEMLRTNEFYDEKGEEMPCNSVDWDTKECYVQNLTYLKNETAIRYISLENLTEKKEISEELSTIDFRKDKINLKANSNITLRFTYSHPISIPSNKPNETENKYNIKVTSEDLKYESILDPTWWNTSYTICVPLNVSGGQDNISQMFPFWVKMYSSASASINSTTWGNIRFVNNTCNNDGSAIPYEFDYMNSSEAGVWLGNSLNTGINNFSVYISTNMSINNTELTLGLWKDYSHVYHFSENGGNISIDSALGNNLTANMSSFQWINASFGTALNTTNLACGFTFLNQTSDLTGNNNRSVFVKANRVGSATDLHGDMVSIGWADTNMRWAVRGSDGGNWIVAGNAAANDWDTGVAIDDNLNWHYVEHALVSDTGTTSWFKNMTSIGTPFSHNFTTVSSRISIGGAYFTDYTCVARFNGTIDDVRISNKTFSSSYINRTYQNGNASTYSFGTAVTYDEVASSLNISLVSPSNRGWTNSLSRLFQFNFTKSNTDLANTTLYIWNSSGSIVQNITVPATGYSESYLNNDSSLVLWLKLDENDTTQYDSSGNGKSGTVVNATWNSSGKYGGGYMFNGNNSGITFNKPLMSYKYNFSISAWFITNCSSNSSGSLTILASSNNSGFDRVGITINCLANSNNLFSGIYNGTSYISKKSIDFNITYKNFWNFVAVTYTSENNNLSFYFNSYIANGSQQPALSGSKNITLIGSDIDFPSGNKYFNGSIDDVRIYNRSLSESEVYDLYNITYSDHVNITATLPSDGTYTWNAFVSGVSNSISAFASGNFTLFADTLFPLINFTSPTQPNGTIQNTRDIIINASIVESNLSSLKYTFNNTQIDLMNGLVMWLGMNNLSALGENATYVFDSSGNGNFMNVLSGAVFKTNGKFGGAYNITNRSTLYNNNVLAGLTNNISTGFTYNIWTNFYQLNSSFDIYNLFLNSSGSVVYRWITCNQVSYPNMSYFQIVNESGTYDGSPCVITNTGSWVMQTVVVNNTNASIYINGALNASWKVNGLRSVGAGYKLNYFGGVTGTYLDIDDVMIWNRSLSAQEISLLYSQGTIRYNLTSYTFYANQSNLADGTYEYNLSISDLAGNTNQTETRLLEIDSSPPNVTFSFQNPNDINVFSQFGNILNISYNTSDVNFNESTVIFFYKTNTTTSNAWHYTNGSADIIGYANSNSPLSTLTYYNLTNNWYFELLDNSIYPATYNFNQEYMEHINKSRYSTTNQNSVFLMEFVNVKNNTNYNIFEIFANATSGSSVGAYYYCNSSYVNGQIASNSNCIQFASQTATQTSNHSHYNSTHWLFNLPINATTGKINTIVVTNKSYIGFKPAGASGRWDIYYISNSSRQGAVKTSANAGVSYTNQTYTADSHLHQFDGTDTFYYYMCANDTLGNQNCSSLRSDLINLTGLIPEVTVTNPTENIYKGNININYTYYSPNNYALATSNISLSLTNGTYYAPIRNNNSNNLSYIWDSSGTADGMYLIKVWVTDNATQKGFGYSANITLDNTKPNLTIISPVNGYSFPDFTTRIDIPVNISTGDTNLNNCYYNLTGIQNITNTLFTCANGYNNFSFNLSNAGSFNLWVTSNDTAGNINYTSINFTVTVYSGSTGGGSSGGSTGGAYTPYNENMSVICNDSYYFIIKHINSSGSVIYNTSDLETLTNKITLKIGNVISQNLVKSVLDNFSICNNYTSLRLPVIKKLEEEVKVLNTSIFDLSPSLCSPKINGTFLKIYDMDSSIPFLRIYNGDMSCESIERLRWIFRIENSDMGYKINGIKLYPLLFGVLGYIIYLIVKLLIKSNRQK